MGYPSRYGRDHRGVDSRAQCHRVIDEAVRPVLEGLEQRQLLSVSFADGVLSIVGGEGNDNVQVRPGTAGHFRVNVNGERHYFKASKVKQVRFDGGAGDDAFIIHERGASLRFDVVASGGDGNDTLTGASGDDSLYGGAGDDVLVGGRGDNLLVGDEGDDILLGREGNDRLYGRAGNDTLHKAGGNDKAVGGAGDDTINAYEKQFPVIDSFTADPTGYSVSQMRNAYGFGPVDGNPWTGRGQAIAIVGVFDLPRARQDLNVFSREMGIPNLKSKQLRVVNLAPKRRRLFDEGWNTEAMLDLQWAHAIAPQAKIYMVQAATNAGGDIEAAILRAVKILNNNHRGGVVSMSLGQYLDRNVDRASNFVFRGDQMRNISFIAASGDIGGISAFPAFSPNVTSVGGTTLYLDEFGNRVPGALPSALFDENGFTTTLGGLPQWGTDLDCLDELPLVPGGERAWWDGSGGFSTVFPVPDFQQNRIGAAPGRGVPDVAWNGDPRTGVSVYNSLGAGGQSGWATVGGTSAGAPQFAALVAIVNQLRKQQNLRPVGSTLNERIYRLGGRGGDNYFNDITLHGNGRVIGEDPCNPVDNPAAWVNKATFGWDPATGWGSPNAQALVPALANDKASSGRPAGRVNLFRDEDIDIAGTFTADDPFIGFDIISFNGTTRGYGAGTITLEAMTTTTLFRSNPGAPPTTGFSLVDIYGQDEQFGAPFSNGWTIFALNGQVVRQQLNQGTGTPITLFRNGDQVSGFAFVAVTDLTIPTGGGGNQTAPTPIDVANAPHRVTAVRFEGRISKSGKLSGNFFSVNFEGEKLKREFGNRVGTFVVNARIKD